MFELAMQVSVHVKRQESLRFEEKPERITAIQYGNSNCFTLCVSKAFSLLQLLNVLHDFFSVHKPLWLGAPKKTPHVKPTVCTWDKRGFGWLRKDMIFTVTPFRTKTPLSFLKTLGLQSLDMHQLAILLGLLVWSILSIQPAILHKPSLKACDQSLLSCHPVPMTLEK